MQPGGRYFLELWPWKPLSVVPCCLVGCHLHSALWKPTRGGVTLGAKEADLLPDSLELVLVLHKLVVAGLNIIDVVAEAMIMCRGSDREVLTLGVGKPDADQSLDAFCEVLTLEVAESVL